MSAHRLLLLILGLLPAAVLATLPSDGVADHNLFLPVVSTPISLTPSSNLDVMAATYLGGANTDLATGVDVAPDRTVVLAGTLPGFDPGGVTPVPLLGGGAGIVASFAPDGRSLLTLTRIGNQVNDVAVAEDGRIAVCGDFGVALLAPDAASADWHAPVGAADRCDAGSNGMTAVLAGADLFVYAGNGSLLGQWSGSGQHWADVAVDEGRQQVILTGYRQVSTDLQVPLIKAYTADGMQRWTAYNFAAAAVTGQNLTADSRGLLVAMGRDGWLYFAGRADGGNTVFTRSPQDVLVGLPSSILIKTDAYNDPYQLSGSKNIGFYARFHPDTGAILRGQFMLTRLSDGGGNSIQAHGIMADENGRLYVAGQAYATLENRDGRTINAIPVGPYGGGEPFLLIVTPDFRQRVIWTPWAGSGGAGGSPAAGVSVRGGVAATAVGLAAGAGSLITVDPLQPARGGDADAYLAVWQQGGE